MNTIWNETKELQTYFCPFGCLDVERACNIGDELWIYENELFEIIDDTRINYWCDDFKNIDPVASVLDHILQMTRNKIEELTGYDFINDFSWNWTEIYTYWNYMCSSYDYSQDAVDELQEKIAPVIGELNQDKFCRYFLSELNIGG